MIGRDRVCSVYANTERFYSYYVSRAAYYGILFPGSEEAAFSNFRMFEATGSVIGYAISPVLCTGTKLWMLAVLMVIGMAGFICVDRMRRREEGQAVASAGGLVELRGVKRMSAGGVYATDDLVE